MDAPATIKLDRSSASSRPFKTKPGSKSGQSTPRRDFLPADAHFCGQIGKFSSTDFERMSGVAGTGFKKLSK
jgi:hypothetical protein